jgi:hypothetical protein
MVFNKIIDDSPASSSSSESFTVVLTVIVFFLVSSGVFGLSNVRAPFNERLYLSRRAIVAISNINDQTRAERKKPLATAKETIQLWLSTWP